MTDSFNTPDQGTQEQVTSDPTQQQFSQESSQPTTSPDYNVDGKHFQDLNALKNGYAHSQQFISTLKEEKTAVEQQLQEALALVNQLKEKEVSANSLLDQQANTNAILDPNELVNAVTEKLKQEEVATRQEANFRQAATRLQALYGAEADAKVTSIAGDNGMSHAEAVQLAKSNPVLFEKLFLPKQEQREAPTSNAFAAQSASGQVPQQAQEQKFLWQYNDSKALGDEFARRKAELYKQYNG